MAPLFARRPAASPAVKKKKQKNAAFFAKTSVWLILLD
jgi:hypothetical protein